MIPIRDTVPREGVPIVTRLIIVANILVFLYQILISPFQEQGLVEQFGVVPVYYTHPFFSAYQSTSAYGYWPFLTSMFLHGGVLHILSNMWILWVFGDNVEGRMGPFKFLVFYLTCGVIAMLVHTITNPTSHVPAIGASGAIAGVMGAYFLLFPRSYVITLIPIVFIPLFVPIPAFVFLLLWFLMQLFSGTMSLLGGAQAGIAWWAHIGGFIAGMWGYSLFLKGDARPPKRQLAAPMRKRWDDDWDV